jgi:DNA sulfur modification protein DndD
MKIKSVRIQNFKLLREVALDFSVDSNRPVTVIRAENGSGKTSALTALQWGLYGDAGLEQSAREVRLSPSDWPDGKRCEIRVQIDFAHTVYDEVGGELVANQTSYRILRTVMETPKGQKDFTRERDQMHLFELTDSGSEEQAGPDVRLGEMLPIEMKDVFFTDGDRAMNFVSPSLTKSTKQHQVRAAIRSLLGLTVLETALEHIRKATSKFNKQLAEATGSAEAATIQTQLEEKRAELKRHRDRVEDLDKQIGQIAKQEEEADRKLLQAMKGVEDHAELAKRLELARKQVTESEEAELRLKKRHQALLGSQTLSWGLLGPKLTEGFEALGRLADKGVIPATALPVLQDRLALGRCICDADLAEGSAARNNVIRLLETQRKVDEDKKILTELYHRGGALAQNRPRGSGGVKGWVSEYDELSKDRLNNKKVLENLQNEIKAIEIKISAIDQGTIEELKKARDAYRADKSRKEADRQDVEINRRPCETKVAELEEKWEQIKAANQAQRKFNNRISVSQDLAGAVKNTLDELQSVYMRKVSDRMNVLFLQMVGADPDAAGGVFKKAEITAEYEIKVLSGDNKTLDPDHELNGASKRALTLSFIWALTEVSGVIAPRVIDTPLGMMSGGVKSRVVEIISNPDLVPFAGAAGDGPNKNRQEFQVVLFLTRQEILMVEDLLDLRAGKVRTLTNSASFPIDLLNDPKVEQPSILVCDCNHRQHCPICARKDDDQHHLIARTVSH